jgi:UDP-glucose 4-epimerase
MRSQRHPRRVLVVGWGFLGAAVGGRLAEDGLLVVGLTRSEGAATSPGRAQGVPIIIGDAADWACLDDALVDVDHVVCCAGGLLPPEAQDDPQADAFGTLSPLLAVLEALRHRPSVGLTYLSSGGTVYGNPVAAMARETDPVAPISVYGASRLAAELYVQTYGRMHGFPVQIIRCANVYGPGQPAERSQGAVAVFLQRVASGLPVKIIGDGGTIRDYVYVGDLAYAVARLVAEQHDVGIVNVGSGRGCSVLDLVGHVSRAVGRPAVLEFVPARRHDVKAIVLDITKLRGFIDYAPLGVPDGLRLTWPRPVADLACSDEELGSGRSGDPVDPEHGTAAP